MSDGWENRFPLTHAWSPVRIGSDHSPIILDSREQGALRPRYFHFDNRWFLSTDFIPMVRDKWEQSSARRPQQIDSLDAWHGSLCFLRQYLKGWNIKQIGEQLKEKNALTDKLLDLDNLAKARSLAPEEWAERYRLEERLESILQMDELAWQQKC